MGKKYEKNEEHRKLVEQMSAVGVSQEQIGLILGISVDTISRHYKDEVSTAKTKANARIAGALYQKALKGDNTCMIFWLKTQARWQETNHLEVTDKRYLIIDKQLTIEEFNAKYGIGLDTAAEAENIN